MDIDNFLISHFFGELLETFQVSYKDSRNAVWQPLHQDKLLTANIINIMLQLQIAFERHALVHLRALQTRSMRIAKCKVFTTLSLYRFQASELITTMKK
jgi:hypothetical protein